MGVVGKVETFEREVLKVFDGSFDGPVAVLDVVEGFGGAVVAEEVDVATASYKPRT